MDKQISAFDSAYEMICDTEHQEVMDEGMEIMKQLADEGDMHAAVTRAIAEVSSSRIAWGSGLSKSRDERAT